MFTLKRTGAQLLGIASTGVLLTGLSIMAFAQNDNTGADLDVISGNQTLYAGDSSIDGDVCSAAAITAGTTIEGVVCNTTQNSISLQDIYIKPNRQNPVTFLSDVIIEDLRGFATSNYTVTAEVSDFDNTTGTTDIVLGTNPDNATGLDVGQVSSIQMLTVGAGYSNNVTVAISAPALGTAATAVPVIVGGQVTGINLTNQGTGYTEADPVTVTITDNGGTPTTPATAFAWKIPKNDNLSIGTIDAINVTNGGTGYTTAPTVTVSAPASGTTATAYATVAGGVITKIVVSNPGDGYATGDTVTVTIAGPGTGATATAIKTAAGAAQSNVFVTLDPSVGTLKGLKPASYSMTNFARGPRAMVTNKTTQHTLFSSNTPVVGGRFGIDNVEFGLRVPGFVAAGTYEATITQTVIN
jgi:hypothetical protein